MPTSPAEPQLVRLTRRPPQGVAGLVLRASKPGAAPAPLPPTPPVAASVPEAPSLPPTPSVPTLAPWQEAVAQAALAQPEAPALVAEPLVASPSFVEAPPAVAAPLPPSLALGQAGAVVDVGLDLGRSEVRVFDGTRLLTFPALLGGPVANIRRGGESVVLENLEKNLHLRWEGISYSKELTPWSNLSTCH